MAEEHVECNTEYGVLYYKVGNKTVYQEDTSPTLFLKTVHRHN